MRYDKNIKIKIVSEYESGKDSIQLSLEYGISSGTIGSWIRKFSTPRHPGPKSKINNESYFRSIDTEEKAYWLGWIMADGCISLYNGQYSLKLHISIMDKVLIDSFLVAIDSSNKTKFKPEMGNGSYYVSLTSRVMIEDLIKLGVVERKTGLEHIPEEIPHSLIKDFLRGFFDGDGITDISRCRSGFVSSVKMLNQIQLILGTSQKIHVANNSTAFYFLGGIKFSEELFLFLYKDASIFLNRKYERLKFISRVNTEIISVNKMAEIS